MKDDISPESRWSRRVIKTEKCWFWTGSIKGYGQFKVNGKGTTAHRFCWEIHFGAIPAGLSVLHRCDVRNCVNPKHLFLGTTLDNMKDKVSKNRQAKGSKNGRATTTEAVVAEIKKLLSETDLPQTEIARRFNVGPQVIFKIKHRRQWTHVPWP